MHLQRLKTFIGLHYIPLLYGLVVSGLLIGLFQGFHARYSLYVMGLYVLPLLTVYFTVYRLSRHKKWVDRIQNMHFLSQIQEKLAPGTISILFLAFIAVIFIVHGLLLHGYPGLYAIAEFSYYTLYDLRKSVTADVPLWFNYIYSFTIRAIIPFALVYTLLYGKKSHFGLLLLFAFLFGLNSMQKSHFMALFLPLALLLLYQKKYLKSLATFVLIGFSVFLLVFITNPELKYSVASKFVDLEFRLEDLPQQQNEIRKLDKISLQRANKAAVNSIVLRTIYLPGEMVGKWFDAIPEEKPFLRGKGYRIFAQATQQTFHDYSQEMYPVLYPEYTERGYSGSVNVASFMYDYANWGLAGIPLSACITALFLFVINTLYLYRVDLKIALNTMPVLMLSSVNYTTLLFSGGWGLLVILFLIFIPKKQGHDASH